MHLEPFEMDVDGTRVLVRQRGENNTYDIDLLDKNGQSPEGFTVGFNLPDRPESLEKTQEMISRAVRNYQKSKNKE